MNRDRGLPNELIPARAATRPAVPVLIQVPALGSGPHIRPLRRTAAPARRRRLRREVRMAGVGLLAGLPLTCLTLALGLGGPLGAAQASKSGKAADPAGVVSVVETAPIAPPDALDAASWEPAPVILPGYLLPVEDLEDPAHAGS